MSRFLHSHHHLFPVFQGSGHILMIARNDIHRDGYVTSLKKCQERGSLLVLSPQEQQRPVGISSNLSMYALFEHGRIDDLWRAISLRRQHIRAIRSMATFHAAPHAVDHVLMLSERLPSTATPRAGWVRVMVPEQVTDQQRDAHPVAIIPITNALLYGLPAGACLMHDTYNPSQAATTTTPVIAWLIPAQLTHPTYRGVPCSYSIEPGDVSWSESLDINHPDPWYVLSGLRKVMTHPAWLRSVDPDIASSRQAQALTEIAPTNITTQDHEESIQPHYADMVNRIGVMSSIASWSNAVHPLIPHDHHHAVVIDGDYFRDKSWFFDGLMSFLGLFRRKGIRCIVMVSPEMAMHMFSSLQDRHPLSGSLNDMFEHIQCLQSSLMVDMKPFRLPSMPSISTEPSQFMITTQLASDHRRERTDAIMTKPIIEIEEEEEEAETVYLRTVSG